MKEGESLNRQCDICEFFDPYTDRRPGGICVRYPPLWVGGIWRNPPVDEYGFCGEWAERSPEFLAGI